MHGICSRRPNDGRHSTFAAAGYTDIRRFAVDGLDESAPRTYTTAVWPGGFSAVRGTLRPSEGPH